MTAEQEIDSLKKLLAVVTQQRDAALMRLGFTEEEIQVAGMKKTDEGVSVQLTHPSFEAFAIEMVRSFKDSGAVNYNMVGIHDPESDDYYEITMQKRGGKTPAMLNGELQDKIAKLEAQLEGHSA